MASQTDNRPVALRPGGQTCEIAGALFYALLMITTRAFKTTESSASLMFYPQLGMSITGIGLVAFYWVTPSLVDLGLFAFAGVFGSIGVLCLTHAFRMAPVAAVAPFEYTALIWATLLGYLLWDELPDAVTLLGSAFIIGSGLYIIYRETRAAGHASRKPTSISPEDASV